MKGYCNDHELDDEQVYELDECYAIAFKLDLDIVQRCRQINFYTAEEVKYSDCTDDDSRADVAVS